MYVTHHLTAYNKGKLNLIMMIIKSTSVWNHCCLRRRCSFLALLITITTSLLICCHATLQQQQSLLLEEILTATVEGTCEQHRNIHRQEEEDKRNIAFQKDEPNKTAAMTRSSSSTTTTTTMTMTASATTHFTTTNTLSDDATTATTTVTSSSSSSSSSSCTLYLAPSTIPHAGLGIFTTIPKKVGDTIGHGDVFVPLLDLEWYNSVQGGTHHHSAASLSSLRNEWMAIYQFFNPTIHYVWTGESMGMSSEVESDDDISALGLGLDAAINCNLALLNVGKVVPLWDDGGLHRSKDPGAGALSPYHNGTTPVINRDIPAGGELFKHYGDSWFEGRPDQFGNIPLTEDYTRAQQLLHAFGRVVGVQKANPQSNQSSTTTAIRHDDHDDDHTTASLLHQLPVYLQRDLWTLVVDLPLESRTLNALPKKLEEAWVAIYDDLTTLYQPYAIRSEAYLQEHGKCLDHIRPGRSTIPQAGRGAFAVRPLQKDTIISGSPLLHLPHYQVLNMYEFEHVINNDTDNNSDTTSNVKTAATRQRQRKSDTATGRQVMLNYCFTHLESTLLLCPYGAGVNYINHNQTLANVKVQWSRHGLTSQDDAWFQRTPNDMEWIYQTNLALDYVALRDIEEEEELFLDYGDEFEIAWQAHVAKWEPVENAKSYASAHDFNLRHARTPLRTDREQELDPYPQHLQLRCHSNLSDPKWQHLLSPMPSTRTDTSNIDLLLWPLNEKGISCLILQRYVEKDMDYYNVQFDDPLEGGIPIYRYRVPRRAIAFVDRPYSTDIHLHNAFRYPILIPDDIFPDAWRNANHKVMPETPSRVGLDRFYVGTCNKNSRE